MATVEAPQDASMDVFPMQPSVEQNEQQEFQLSAAIQNTVEQFRKELEESVVAINQSRTVKGPVTERDFELGKRRAIASMNH